MSARPLLSVVIPTWNEEKRIQATLATVTTYLSRQEYSAEVIVVDDGSSDGTVAAVRSFIEQYSGPLPVRLIENEHRGKGYAVRTGMLAGEGTYVLFTDADLSTPISEVGKMVGALQAGADVAIGTRQGIGAERRGEPFYRHLLGRIFNLLVRLILGLNFQDTQAGFKGFRREVAQDIFNHVRLYGANARVLKHSAVTGFDVEVLYLAWHRGYRIDEIPIHWQYGTESKVRPLVDSLRMLWDVLRVRRMADQGLYERKR